MRRDTQESLDCPIARTVAVIGDFWTPLILRDVYAGITRFDGIQANLGVSRKVLAERLSSLVDHGILEKRPYQSNPPRFDYALTEKGLELGGVLLAMKGWGDRWTGTAETTPPMQIRHERCGQVIEPTLSCSGCGEPLHPHELAIVAQDGAVWPAPLTPVAT